MISLSLSSSGSKVTLSSAPNTHDKLSLDSIHPSASLCERLDHLGQEFLVGFYQVVTERQPENLEALAELAQAHTRLGQWERGLELDRRLVRILPEDPTIRYNLSCSLALTDRTLESLEALEAAIALGYDDVEYLLRDPDMSALQNEPRFVELVRRLRLATTY